MDKTTLNKTDRQQLNEVADGLVIGVRTTDAINVALKRFVKRRGFEALARGSANPKVSASAKDVETAKLKKANPFLRFLWLSLQEKGLAVATANNLVSIIKAQAKKGLYLGETGGKSVGKRSGPKEPALRVLLVGEPDELTIAMGLQTFLQSKGDAFPELAAFVLPAVNAYLGDAAE